MSSSFSNIETPANRDRPSESAAESSFAAWISTLETSVRAADSFAFPVAARVIRRVIRHELEITSVLTRLPHRKSYVISRERLMWLVARDELGVSPAAVLPETIILLARPADDDLVAASRTEVLRYYWRLLFHAKLDQVLWAGTSPERLTASRERELISQIGQTQFDEVRAVLKQEGMLPPKASSARVLAEFIATAYELKFFAPDLLPLYFPSVPAIDSLLPKLWPTLDAPSLYAACRPTELPMTESPFADPVLSGPVEMPAARFDVVSARARRKWERRAERQQAKGNVVGAAIALQYAWEAGNLVERDATLGPIQACLLQLVDRLKLALEIEAVDSPRWQVALAAVLQTATGGYWNPAARLLYDLQKVCIDHERDIYRLDLWRRIVSLGKEPLKTPLETQRVVLISKHLRSAVARLPRLTVPLEIRHTLDELLDEAAHAAEKLLRRKLTPIAGAALASAGLKPVAVVERVAFGKVSEELMDGVVQRGFITMGDLRDSLSRNSLKMPDLAGFTELFGGDLVLRADRALADRLKGVYLPGPFYLRLFQRLSSLAFALPAGRWFTRYLALPFGGAYVLLGGVYELLELGHKVGLPHYHLPVSLLVWPLGAILLPIIHWPLFRSVVWQVLRFVWRVAYGVCIDLPQWLAGQYIVQLAMRSVPVMLLRRYMWTPLVLTLTAWLLLPAVGLYNQPSGWGAAGIFAVALVLLNSRVGRDTEELLTEWMGQTWHRVRVHVVVALINIIVDTFKQVMDWIERVLYAVDEWLRFRSGETNVTLVLKSVLGLGWSVVNGVIRFCVTLLIEPQVNPIKHFPVVTVSHKLIFPFVGTLTKITAPLLSPVLVPLLGATSGTALANSSGFIIITCIPGIFGFLVWELKENWRLYAANRPKTLEPVLVGHHGETVLRLLLPGFHSGTIPKLFAKRRRVARKMPGPAGTNRQMRYSLELAHTSECVQHFVKREWVDLVAQSHAFRGLAIGCRAVELSTNRIRVQLVCTAWPDSPAWVTFAEQSGRLVAHVPELGWFNELNLAQRRVVESALIGLYQLARVQIVYEQVEANLRLKPGQYDVSEHGLTVWPDARYELEVYYPLSERPNIYPRPRAAARIAGLEGVPAGNLLFSQHPVGWIEWQAYWESEARGEVAAPPVSPVVKVLPG